MQVFVRDLYKYGTGVSEKLASEKQPLLEVGEVTMDAKRPSVAVGADHFRLAANVCICRANCLVAHLILPIRRKFDAVGRIEVDHLHLARQPLAATEGTHHLQAVAEDEAVGPIDIILVELAGLRGIQPGIREEVPLPMLPAGSGQDGLGTDALMNV